MPLPAVRVAGRVVKRRSPTWRVIVVAVVGADSEPGMMVGAEFDCGEDIFVFALFWVVRGSAMMMDGYVIERREE